MRGVNLSGIYKITCSINGKVYVGSAVNIRQRWSGHISDLRNNKNRCKKLQNAWNAHGEAAFQFSVLELVEQKERLIEREQFWIDELKVVQNGYNIAPKAGSTIGYKASEETRKKLSLAGMGRKPSEETRRKLSDALRGRKMPPHMSAILSKTHKGKKISDAHKEAVRRASTGRIASDATRAKLSESMKGRVFSDAHRANLSASRTGIKLSDETRARMSKARRGIPHTDAHREKIAVANRLRAAAGIGKPTHTPESRRAIAVASKAYWTPEKKAEQSAKQTGSKHTDATRKRMQESAKKLWAIRKQQKQIKPPEGGLFI